MQFTKTIGHEKQKMLLDQIVKNGRLAHAYVFAGPENVGKTTFALELAGILGADSIMDLAVFDSEEGLKIETAREIQNRLSLTPVGILKVAVITHAENMTVEAANCLLKTLEEPPGRSLLILVTSNFHALLPTVRSRVQRINFGLLADSEISADVEIRGFAGGRIGLAKRLLADEKLLEFYRQAAKIYKILYAGSDFDRLKTAEALAQMEEPQIQAFLKYAGSRFVREPQGRALGEKILGTFRDLQYNLNVKLAMDNLFI